MVVRHISLVMAATVGVMVLGAILAIIWMLSTERGRTVLKVLLIVPALALVVALLTLFGWRAGSFARHQAEARRLVDQRSDLRRAQVREALAEASAHFDSAIARLRLDDPDPEASKALAEASARVNQALCQLDRPSAEVDRAMAELQANIQEQLSKIDHPDPKIREAFAKASVKIEEMRAKLEAMRPGRPGAHATVSGTVKCIDKPIADGTIRFVPIAGTGGPVSSAKIADGRYAIPAISKGTYRVEITATRPRLLKSSGPDFHEFLVDEQLIPAQYNAESNLAAELWPGSNTFNFELGVDLDDERAAPESPDAVAMADEDKAESDEPPERVEEPVDEPAAAVARKEEVAEEETPPAEDRPEWVDATPRKLGSVYQMKAKLLYADQEEFDREFPKALRTGIDEYVMEHLREPHAREKIRLPLDYIQTEIVKEKWEETLQIRITPEGQIPEEHVPMTQLYVLLEFDHKVNARIEEEWDKVVVTERLFGVGSLAGMVLMLLAGVYAYLRIDLATGGAYRGRLRLAAAAVLLLAILAGLVLSAA